MHFIINAQRRLKFMFSFVDRFSSFYILATFAQLTAGRPDVCISLTHIQLFFIHCNAERGLTPGIWTVAGLVDQQSAEESGGPEGAAADAPAAAESHPGGHCLRQAETSQWPGGCGSRRLAQTKSLVRT